MKRFVFVTLTILTALQTNLYSAVPQRLQVYFFGSRTCGECLEIKENVLIPLQKEFPNKLDLKIYYTETDSGFELLSKMEDAYKAKIKSPQQLFLPDTLFSGYDDIMSLGENYIRTALNDSTKWIPRYHLADNLNKKQIIKERLTFWYVTFFGIVDGFNPCAIAAMIFLVSVLATQKRKRNEIILIGLTYTASVYITYLLLGLGLLNVITTFRGFPIFTKILKWVTVIFASIVALGSFKDAFSYYKSKKISDIKLQLPKSIKLRMHNIIKDGLKSSHLIIGALTMGFLVTLFEAVCTGQVYIPIIAALSEPGMRLTGLFYLAYYNLLFVLPLIIVMISVFYGVTWEQLANSSKKHMVLVKSLIGIGLVVLILYMLFFYR